MKLKIFFFFIALMTCFITQASAERIIYIMLNIDNTILDRTLPCTQSTFDQLSKNGFKGQKLEFEGVNNCDYSVFASVFTIEKKYDKQKDFAEMDNIILTIQKAL